MNYKKALEYYDGNPRELMEQLAREHDWLYFHFSRLFDCKEKVVYTLSGNQKVLRHTFEEFKMGAKAREAMAVRSMRLSQAVYECKEKGYAIDK